MKQDNAFTGLEAAIVLIAFVVVAAIFSYVLLGAGFFATQKAQEVTYAGIKQAVSNAVIDGSMYANTDEQTNALNGITFNVRIPLGGEPINMETTEFFFASSKNTTPQRLMVQMQATDNRGQLTPIDPGDAYELKGYYPPPADSQILTSGQFATYQLIFGEDDNANGEYLVSKDWFSLEMRPRIGAATLITKTIGSGLVSGDTL